MATIDQSVWITAVRETLREIVSIEPRKA